MCNCAHTLLDRDLPPLNRVEAMYWQVQYLQAVIELRKANRGLARLRKRLDAVRNRK